MRTALCAQLGSDIFGVLVHFVSRALDAAGADGIFHVLDARVPPTANLNFRLLMLKGLSICIIVPYPTAYTPGPDSRQLQRLLSRVSPRDGWQLGGT